MLVVGLGNPGPEYAQTRHNIGFMVLDALAREYRIRFRDRGDYAQASLPVAGEYHILLKPLCYMNNSGRVISALARQLMAPLLVVCDDFALPLGRIRIRSRGSDGGHQGLASIISELGTTGFPRVRIGINPVPPGLAAADYVLSEFLPEERRILPEIIAAGRDAVTMILTRGLSAAMNHYNGLLISPRTAQ